MDVEPGCAGRGSRRCFSVAIVEDGRLVAKYEGVMLHRLVRLVWEYRPDIVAVDNIHEIGDEKEVARFVSLLPENTSIVQVTMLDDGTPISVKALAASAGLEVQGKLSPSRTAYLLAILASKGYGVKLRFLEEKTKIIVSRSKSPGKGGSSSARYQRNIRASILRAVKDIKKVLDRAGLDYDLVFRKSGGGLDSAVFIVYAPREKLYGLIKPRNDGKIKVEIKPVYSSHTIYETSRRIDYEPKRYLIVGVDPGPSTGIAALDLNGKLVFVVSRKGLDRQEAIELITKHGVPLVIATDVKPAPEYVKKLASILGAAVYEPPEPLSVEEKRELAQKYAEGHKLDPHERDALAAAVKAYNYYADKLKQIEAAVSRYGIEIDASRVAASVIKGATVAEAVEKEIANILYSEDEPGLLLKRVRHSGCEENMQQNLERVLEKLRKEVERLEAEKKLLEAKVKELLKQLEERDIELRILKNEVDAAVEAERRIQHIRHELELLKRELEKARNTNKELKTILDKALNALTLTASGLAIPVLNVKNMSRNMVKALHKTRTRIIRIEDAGSIELDVVRQLAETGVKIIIAKNTSLREVFREHGILVVPDEVTLEVIGNIALVDPNMLGAKLVEEYSSLGAAREAEGISIEKLKKIIEEYRLMRIQELNGSDEDSMLENS